MDRNKTILFLGDVVPYKQIKFRSVYKTVINLECPIVKNVNPVKGKVILSVAENYLQGIFKENLLSVCLGNNHILDYGIQGLDSTIEELNKIGTKWFGINREPEGKIQPLLIEISGIKLAFLSVVCSSTSPIAKLSGIDYLSLLNEEDLCQEILKLKGQVNRIVVYIHWGIEESSYPTAKDVLIARQLIDIGAEIIIGSHAHAPQPIERYKNGIIAYNLGNFLMPELRNEPSYYNENGIPQSSYSKKNMLWNRISWGLLIDIQTLDFKIKKFMFIRNRVIELPFTPMDRYLKLNTNALNPSLGILIKPHLKKRELWRKIINFIYSPYVPEKFKRKS